MKNSSKLLALASISTGVALGVLFAPGKGSETRKKLNKRLEKLSASMNGECSKEKLVMVKQKLEEHKQRVEKHLQKINSKIATYDAADINEGN
jgi:gas vesicle protein